WKTVERVYREAPIGLCCFDLDLRYVQINEWLAEVNGLPVEEHMGKVITEVLPQVPTGVIWQILQVIDTGEPVLYGIAEAETLAEPGRKKLFEHCYYPVKSDDGTTIGVSCVVQYAVNRDYFRKVVTKEEVKKEEDKMLNLDHLTNREMDVLGLTVKRLKGRQIADQLSISPQTVKTHLRNIYRKLGVNNSRSAAAKLRSLGILDDDLS
ncbi:MAG: helix-turn-helix transcriptional regulator, partial [Verrucomicrobiota bacterium]